MNSSLCTNRNQSLAYMKVSIVTVMKNVEAVVVDALASIKAQDYPNLEHIVVDGVSSDQTLTLVEQHRIENSIVVSERDSGIYDAMNKGIALATGDAILFLNADDRFAQPSAISDLVHELSIAPRVDFTFGDVVVHSPETDFYKRHSHINKRNIGFEMVCHQAILAHRSLFDRVGGFNTAYKICADLDWLLRSIDSGASFRYVPKPIAQYSAGGESDRNIDLRKKEKAEIICKYRSSFERGWQRIASALRRRLQSNVG